VSLTVGAVEGAGVASILQDLIKRPGLELHTDVSAAKAVAERPGLRSLKHIDIKLLFLQQWVSKRVVSLRKIGTDQNPADLLTKHLHTSRISTLLASLGCSYIGEEPETTEANHIHQDTTGNKSTLTAAAQFTLALTPFLGSFGRATADTGEEHLCLKVEGEETAAGGEKEGNHVLLNWFSVVLIFVLGMITTVLMQRLWQCIRRTPQTEEGCDDETTHITPQPANPADGLSRATTTGQVNLPPTRVYTTATGRKFHSWDCGYLCLAKRKQNWKEWSLCSSCADTHHYSRSSSSGEQVLPTQEELR
jgi:hypothetical protein